MAMLACLGDRRAHGHGALPPPEQLGHVTNKKTTRMATLEMIEVVQPIALEWFHPEDAIAASSAIMPIEKLMPRSGRMAVVERAAVAGGASGCVIAINALEAMTAMMNATAATADAWAARSEPRDLPPTVRNNASIVAANPPKKALTDPSCAAIAVR